MPAFAAMPLRHRLCRPAIAAVLLALTACGHGATGGVTGEAAQGGAAARASPSGAYLAASAALTRGDMAAAADYLRAALPPPPAKGR